MFPSTLRLRGAATFVVLISERRSLLRETKVISGAGIGAICRQNTTSTSAFSLDGGVVRETTDSATDDPTEETARQLTSE